MKIIEKIKTNTTIDNQTEIQKICINKLQSSPLPNTKSELWRLSNKSKFSNFLDYSVNEKNPKFDTKFTQNLPKKYRNSYRNPPGRGRLPWPVFLWGPRGPLGLDSGDGVLDARVENLME